MDNLAIAETHPFRNLAASAHHWQPLTACVPDDLPDWLSQQRQLGYSLIALDANPAAMPLTKFVFPQKTVLVLGRELTGIPIAILEICDRALSIPQGGMVESLNVQTAGAIAIYEYIRQQSLSPA